MTAPANNDAPDTPGRPDAAAAARGAVPWMEASAGPRAPVEAARRARDTWVSGLSPAARERLFELELLLAGLACFADPRHHPRPSAESTGSAARAESAESTRSAARSATDRRPALAIVLAGERRLSELAKALLEGSDRPRWPERGRPFGVRAVEADLVDPRSAPDAPQRALLALRQGMTVLAATAEAMLRADRISLRALCAHVALVAREAERSWLFDPRRWQELAARPEDLASIGAPALAERTPPAAKPVVASFCARLGRLLRALEATRSFAADGDETATRAWIALALVRYDVRELVVAARTTTAGELAAAYEVAVLAPSAGEMRRRASELATLGRQLSRIASAVEAVASGVAFEVRHALSPASLSDPALGTSVRDRIERAASRCLAAIRTGALALHGAVGLPASGALEGSMPRETIERLRRDAWMLGQVARAFAAKARHGVTAPGWRAGAGATFARDFLDHYRVLGHALLLAIDPDRADDVLRRANRLVHGDPWESGALEDAARACDDLQAALDAIIERLSRGPALDGAPFDRREAARALREHLAR